MLSNSGYCISSKQKIQSKINQNFFLRFLEIKARHCNNWFGVKWWSWRSCCCIDSTAGFTHEASFNSEICRLLDFGSMTIKHCAPLLPRPFYKLVAVCIFCGTKLRGNWEERGGGSRLRSSEEEEVLVHSAGTAQPRGVWHLGSVPGIRTALKRCQNELGQTRPKST